jgi:hypothetical protein
MLLRQSKPEGSRLALKKFMNGPRIWLISCLKSFRTEQTRSGEAAESAIARTGDLKQPAEKPSPMIKQRH